MLPRRSNAVVSLLSLLALFALVLGSTPLVAAQGGTRGNPAGFTAEPLPDGALEGLIDSPVSKTEFDAADYVNYLVKIGDAPLATYDGSIAGLAATSPKVTGQPLDVTSPASVAYLAYLNGKLDAAAANLRAAIPGLKVSHRFDVVLGGLAVQLPRQFLERLPFVAGVSAVLGDDLMRIDTFRSPQFIGAPTTWRRLGGQDEAGEGVVVGILDSGIWPEVASFSDPDPAGKPYAPPRPRSDGTAWPCDFGGGLNPGDPASCNNKLISAQRFMDTYEGVIGLEAYEFTSARDDDGHGTHTASTAAGNAGAAVSLLGNDLGTISGVAPRAHVVAYKVCGEQGCFSTDSAAAIQQAIVDGVDVLNFSISGGANPYSDIVGLAFLEAYRAGIFVAASAGNTGPGPETVNHRGPWITTVAASTTDRGFLSTATLVSSSGATLSITGATLTTGVTSPAPVVVNTADPLCQAPGAPGSFAGQIVVCQRGVNDRIAKSANVAAGGAVGMFLFNTVSQGTNTDLHSIPTIHFEGGAGSAAEQLLAFLAANPSVTATFPAGVAANVQGDVIAGFSSRGGPAQTLGVSKPDITGPGVNVLAGYTGLEYGRQTPVYNFISGTSMSSPHIAGAAALLKDLHPDWTPGQIKSALMTTASVAGLVKEDALTPANAFDTGSGRVDLRRAWDPGLTFDETAENYVALQNELWNANYPSLYIPRMPGIVTVKRTVTEVAGDDEEWDLRVIYPSGQPRDWTVRVPREIEVDEYESKTFEITVDGRDVPIGATRFATILLTPDDDDKAPLRFPVTIVRQQAALAVTSSCNPATIERGANTACSVTMTNNSNTPAAVSMLTQLPRELQVVQGSVVGGTSRGRDRVSFNGTIPARLPTDVSAAIDPLASPAGYLPLSLFDITPIAGYGDETIGNFNVPPFSFGGKTYTRIGVVSNGYVVLGGGTSADVNFINTALPNGAAPNNTLAPFWTDLNPAFGGAIRIGTLGDGTNSWIVVDYEAVSNYSTPSQGNSFQVWISYTRPDDISFTYGAVTAGDAGFLTVGAENEEGNTGTTIFLNGAPAANAPAPSFPNGDYEIDVAATPGQTFAQNVTFSAVGRQAGKYVGYTFVEANTFQGTAISRFAGEVTHTRGNGRP